MSQCPLEFLRARRHDSRADSPTRELWVVTESISPNRTPANHFPPTATPVRGPPLGSRSADREPAAQSSVRSHG